MNIGIVTFHRAINYGAILQVFALSKVIGRLGGNAIIIDYISQCVASRNKRMRPSLNPVSLYRYFKYAKTVNTQHKYFEQFLEHMSLSAPVSAYVELNELSRTFDAMICGSDQVWNTDITDLDFHYFLDFVPDSIKKIAYAASFGNTQIPDNTHKTIKKYLSRFYSISVREEAGADLVMQLIGKRPQVVLDPTLLLSVDEWRELKSEEELPQRYILVYSVGEIERLFPTAIEISDKTRLPLVVFSHRKFSTLKNVFYIKSASPSGFIDAFDKADYIITNSFHGTAFSIIFRKKFLIIPRTVDSSKGLGINSRIVTLLEKTNLNGQIFTKGDALTVLDTINYIGAEEKIKAHKQDSIEFIRKSIFAQ